MTEPTLTGLTWTINQATGQYAFSEKLASRLGCPTKGSWSDLAAISQTDASLDRASFDSFWEKLRRGSDGSRFVAALDGRDGGILLLESENVANMRSGVGLDWPQLQQMAESLSYAGQRLWRYDIAASRIFPGGDWGSPGLDLFAQEGASFDEWLAQVHPEDVARVRRALSTAGMIQQELRVVGGPQGVQWIELRGQCLGNIATGTFTNVSDRKHDQLAGVEANSLGLIRELMRATPGAAYLVRPARTLSGQIVDLEVVDANAEACALLGLPAAELSGQLIGDLVPAAREDGLLDRARDAMESGRTLEHESQTGTGFRVSHVVERVVPLGNFLLIASTDVTADRRQREVVRRTESIPRLIAEAIPDIVFVWDLRTERFAYGNQDLGRLLGYPSGTYGHESIWALMHPEDVAEVREHLATLRDSGGRSEGEMLLRLRTATNVFRMFHCRTRLANEGAGLPPRLVVGVAQDVTAERESETVRDTVLRELTNAKMELEARQRRLEALNEQLEHLVVTDSLTGLRNHRAFEDRLTEEVDRASRYDLKLSLLLMDVDHFKAFNDRFGHPEGDQALRQFAEVLVQVSRSSDFVVRLGGEEFAVILPNTSSTEASVFAERIRTELRRKMIEPSAITASFGCASLRPGKEAKQRLIEEADRALYESKRNGRDTITIAPGSEDR